MNKSRQTNGSDGNDKQAAAPMSQISGVRRLQQSNSIVGIVPRFGVEVPDEKPLIEVSSSFDSCICVCVCVCVLICFVFTVVN